MIRYLELEQYILSVMKYLLNFVWCLLTAPKTIKSS